MSGLKIHRGQRVCTLIKFVDGKPEISQVSVVTGTHPFGFDANGDLHFEGYIDNVTELPEAMNPRLSKSEQKRMAQRAGTTLPCPVCAVQQRPESFDKVDQ